MSHPTPERTFYGRILDQTLSGLDRFPAEEFRCCPHVVLVVIPPKLEKVGSIHLPDRAKADQCVARVAAVPADGSVPNLHPGDWVVFRPGSAEPVEFQGRTDFALLEYRDKGGNILGWLPEGSFLENNSGNPLDKAVPEACDSEMEAVLSLP